ncbi:unnamed protein product [Gordionus sp. m RMFG-2023]|uniref:enolase-like n=1 Tax=Gordionus sp. m RMFG-2023 TaxID=3053472 RepID=UPI0030E0F6AB
MTIENIKALEIYDSRGNPTLEVDLKTDQGCFVSMVPSGASTGIHEALELRDNDPKVHSGKGVLKAIKNVNEIISPELISKKVDVSNQTEVDKLMISLDGTINKSKLGANAILGVSMACCKAGAAKKAVPLYQHIANLSGNKNLILPVPSFNVINGGSHAGNQLAMQEFMIMPVGASNFREAMRMGTETYHTLKKLLKDKYGLAATAVGDEGGFAPEVNDAKEVLEILTQAINQAGYKGKIKIALDVAASEFFKDGKYDLQFKNPKSDRSKWLSGEQLSDFYVEMVNTYPIISIEDPFDQDDWPSWQHFFQKIGDKISIVGDDLTVTNPTRIQNAIDNKACNCLLLKVNQIGSLTESIQASQLATKHNWTVMVSHRSGETEDSFIADLVVGLGTGKIKSGAPCRSERLCKYNRLLHIEYELGPAAKYAGSLSQK